MARVIFFVDWTERIRRRTPTSRPRACARPSRRPAASTATEPLTLAEDQPLGRVGDLAEPLALRTFVERLATRLPEAAGGIRVAGPPDAVVRRVAVLGGAGDDLFDDGAGQRAPTSTSPPTCATTRPSRRARRRAAATPYLVDAGHWASEQVVAGPGRARAARGPRGTRD